VGLLDRRDLRAAVLGGVVHPRVVDVLEARDDLGGGDQRALGLDPPPRRARVRLEARERERDPAVGVGDRLQVVADRGIDRVELLEHLERLPDVRRLARGAAAVGLERVAVAAVGVAIGVEGLEDVLGVATEVAMLEAALLEHSGAGPDGVGCVGECLVHRGSDRTARSALARLNDSDVTIAFRLPASAAERVALSYSPTLEAVLSLHVLVEPKHHPLQHGWVRRCRSSRLRSSARSTRWRSPTARTSRSSSSRRRTGRC
jgi:hypothetical protein